MTGATGFLGKGELTAINIFFRIASHPIDNKLPINILLALLRKMTTNPFRHLNVMSITSSAYFEKII